MTSDAEQKPILPGIKTITKEGPDDKKYQYDRRNHTYWDANAHAYVLKHVTAKTCTVDDPYGSSSKDVLEEVPVMSAAPPKSIGREIGDRARAFGGGASDALTGEGAGKEFGKVFYAFGSSMNGRNVTADDVKKYGEQYDRDHQDQTDAEHDHPGFYKSGEAAATIGTVVAPELRAGRALGAAEGAGAARVGKVEVTAGEPVSVATGEYLETWRDFLVPASIPLDGARHMGLHLLQPPNYLGPLGRCQISSFDEVVANSEPGRLILYQSDGKAIPFERPFNFLPSTNSASPHLQMLAPWLKRLELHDRTIAKHFRQYDDGIYRLEKVEDQNGNAIFLHRDEVGLLQRADSTAGLSLDFANDARGRRTSIALIGTTGAGIELARYAYDSLGRMETAKCAFGMSVRYYWHSERDLLLRWHNLTKRSETHFTYDDEGRVLHTRTNGIWNDDRFRYDPANRETTYLPSGDARLAQRFGYDANDNVTHEIDALGGVLQHTLDDAGFETATTDANGNVTTMAYDTRGNVKRHFDAEGRATTYGWGPHGELDVVIDGAGHIRKYENDERGNCLAETDAEGYTTRFIRDERGRLLRTILPDGAEESRAYDAHGRLVSVTDARGGITRFAHDAFGRVVETTDALGHVTRAEYNAGPGGFSTPSAIVRPDGVRVSRAYTEDGVLASVTDGEGRTWRYTHGAFDVLQAIEDPKGGRLSFAYDSEGRVTAVTNQMGVTYHLIRDATGRVTAEEDFDGRRTEYTRDPGGRVVETKKPDGARLAYTYDKTDKLTSIKGYAADDPDKTRSIDETYYWYDGRGLLIRASNLAALIEFERDGNGRIICETVNGRRVESKLDARGNRIERRIGRGEPGEGLVRYARDLLGMVSEIAINHHAPLTFTRDALGRETGRTSTQGFRLDQSWDAIGQLVTQSVGAGCDFFEAFSGRSTSISPNHGGALRRYSWDKAGAPISVADAIWGETTYQYDSNGQVVEAKFGDGSNERFDYNATKDVVGVRHEGVRPSLSVGSLLTWRSTPGGAVQLAFGPNGERVALTHDICGRVVKRRVDQKGFRQKIWKYSWDVHNRLIYCENPQGEIWFYSYDPFGRRLSKVKKLTKSELSWTSIKFPHLVTSSERLATKVWTWSTAPKNAHQADMDQAPLVGTYFTWDCDLIAEEAPLHLDGSISWIRAIRPHFEPKSFIPLAREKMSGALHYIVTDHLGTSREVFGDDGQIVSSVVLTTFGNLKHVRRKAASLANNTAIYSRREIDDPETKNIFSDGAPENSDIESRFQGQSFDEEASLSYNRYRYYDPLAGQYLSPDVIGLRGGDRLHAYVDCPTMRIDPLGLTAKTINVPSAGLDTHEGAGPGMGHTLAKHVDQTDGDLAARLADEPNVPAASTYSSRAQAEKAVHDVLNAKKIEIEAWLKGKKKRLILNYGHNASVGRVLQRGQTAMDPGMGSRVVLSRDASMPNGYRIITAFPTP